MKSLILLLILFIGGCSLPKDVELLRLKNEVTELRETLEKNSQLDEQNWLLDVHQHQLLEQLIKERKQSLI
jgi:hypothetical protein